MAVGLGRRVDALGAVVRFRLPAELVTELERTLVDLTTAPDGAPAREIALEPLSTGGLRLLDEGRVVAPHVEPALAVATVVWQLNAVAAGTTAHVVLHAGCVATPAGGIVLPGASGAGKSTLCAAAVADGFDYLTDEHAALDLATGILTPFAKPIDLGDRGLVPASSLRAGAVGGPCPPAAVVFPRYEAGSPGVEVALDPATTLLALCAQATNLPAVGAPGFALLAGLAEAVPAWQTTYGTSADAVAAVRRAIGRSGPAAPVAAAPLVGPVTPTTATVVIGDAVVVLDTVTWATHRFNVSAGLVWLCAATTTDRRKLVELACDEAPDGALDPAHVEATIDHLTAIGLLGTVAR